MKMGLGRQEKKPFQKQPKRLKPKKPHANITASIAPIDWEAADRQIAEETKQVALERKRLALQKAQRRSLKRTKPIRKESKKRKAKRIHEQAALVLDPKRYASPSQRKRILERDGFKCRYCGIVLNQETANMDHVIPWKKGGRTHLSNLVACCQPCNKAKGNGSVEHLNRILAKQRSLEQSR